MKSTIHACMQQHQDCNWHYCIVEPMEVTSEVEYGSEMSREMFQYKMIHKAEELEDIRKTKVNILNLHSGEVEVQGNIHEQLQQIMTWSIDDW